MRIGLRHGRDGRFFVFPADGEAIIGSEEGCNVLLDDEGLAPRHARVKITRTGIEIDDLASSLPTVVNGYPISKHFLSGKDELMLGSALLVLELDAEGAAGRRCTRCGVELEAADAASAALPKPRCRRCASLPVQPRSGTTSRRASRRGGSSRLPVDDVGGAVSRPTERWSSGAFEEEWLAEYAPIQVLGEGSQGRVYKLLHRATGQVYAGKRRVYTSENARRRLERETEAIQGLRHPSIVALVAILPSTLSSLMVMELVDGPSLAALLAKERRIEPKRALALATRIAEGLAYASARKLVHRDVKPSNILIGPGDAAKLTDFGLVGFADSRTRLTQDGVSVGTPQYMSPEQVMGRAVNPRTDIWGLGATFYEAITGVQPFEGASPPELARKIVNEPLPLEPLEKYAGEAVARVFSRFLAKDPEGRPLPAVAVAELSRLAGD